MVLTIPQNEQSGLYYICGNHGVRASSFMSGTLTLVDPPAPPTLKVVSLSVTTNVVVKSLGTNWTVIPEYNSNLVTGGWTAVPSYTNNYVNGTNTTSFNRLEAICGNNVFLRLRQQSP